MFAVRQKMSSGGENKSPGAKEPVVLLSRLGDAGAGAGAGGAMDPRRTRLYRAWLELRGSLVCGICLDTLVGPVRTRCGHVFCRLCLGKTLDSARQEAARREKGALGTGASCPVCKDPMTKRSLTDDGDTEKVLVLFRKLNKALAQESAGEITFGGDSSAASSPAKLSPVKAVSSPAPSAAAAANTVDLFSGSSIPPLPTTFSSPSPTKSRNHVAKNVDLFDQVAASTFASKKKSQPAGNPPGNQRKSQSPTKKEERKQHSYKRRSDGSKCNVSFQLKGKVVANTFGGEGDRKPAAQIRNVVFVQLGRLSPRRPLTETFPELAEILARKRMSSDHEELAKRYRPIDLDSSRNEDWGGAAPKGKEERSEQQETWNSTEPSSGKQKREDKRKRRISKEKMVKTALKNSAKEASQPSVGGGGGKRRRKSSGQSAPTAASSKRLNALAISQQMTPSDIESAANVSIHTSSLEVLDDNNEHKQKNTVDTTKQVSHKEAPENKFKARDKPKTGAEFMRQIIRDNDQDLYTTDPETPSQVARRLENQKLEEELAREIVLEAGKLQVKRRRVQKRFSESSNGSSVARASPTHKSRPTMERSPSSDIEPPIALSPPKGTSVTKHVSPRYATSQVPTSKSFVAEGDDDDLDLIPISQGSGGEIAVTTAAAATVPYISRRMTKNALASIENVVSSAPRDRGPAKKAVARDSPARPRPSMTFVLDDREETAEKGSSSQDELPDIIPDSVAVLPVSGVERNRRRKGAEDSTSVIRSPAVKDQSITTTAADRLSRASTGTTGTTGTESDADMPSEEIHGRLRDLEEFVKAGPSQKSRDSNNKDGGGDSSDDDLFESTPQAKKKRRSKARPLDSSSVDHSQESKARRKLSVQEQGNDETEKPEKADAAGAEATMMGTAAQPLATLDAAALKSFVIMSTGLSVEDRQRLSKFATFVGCQVRVSLDEAVTHVVVSHDESLRAERTLKYLQAVTRGKMVVGVRWIQDCLEMRALLKPDDYEVYG